jgi:hypothetical protein
VKNLATYSLRDRPARLASFTSDGSATNDEIVAGIKPLRSTALVGSRRDHRCCRRLRRIAVR